MPLQYPGQNYHRAITMRSTLTSLGAGPLTKLLGQRHLSVRQDLINYGNFNRLSHHVKTVVPQNFSKQGVEPPPRHPPPWMVHLEVSTIYSAKPFNLSFPVKFSKTSRLPVADKDFTFHFRCRSAHSFS